MLVDHLDKLQAFKVIAEVGKMREASAKLNLTQPSLTRLVQTLELACGQTLFYRSRQGVTLTEAGKILFNFAVTTLKNLDDIEEKIRHPKLEMAGKIQIGSYESLAEYFWPKFILSLKSIYPELKLSIRTNVTVEHQKALANGQIDMLVDAEPRLMGDFTSYALYKDRFNFFGKKGIFSHEITQTQANDLTLIYCPKAFDEENKSIIKHLEDAGYYFKDRLELDSFTACATFAENGLGPCVLPQRLAINKRLVGIQLKGFSSKGFGAHSICATIRSSSEDDKRLRLMIKMLREWFKI